MGDNDLPPVPSQVDGRLGAASQAGEVMIVDDEPITARGYARALTAAGYNVTVASAGREGATLARSKRFDVIVSDIAMPDMDGLALLRDIRQSDLDVPMIFMTGSPALETALEAIEYGAFRYLLKPVPLEALLEIVHRAVAVHKLALRAARGEPDARSWKGKQIGDRAGLEARFASAVDKLWVAAQPIVSWSGRSIFAYETLLRTDEPTLRSPLDFFDAAERLGKRRRARTHHPPARRALMPGHAAGGARVRQPAPGRSRGRRAVRRRRRADAVREPGRPGDHRARRAGSASTS